MRIVRVSSFDGAGNSRNRATGRRLFGLKLATVERLTRPRHDPSHPAVIAAEAKRARRQARNLRDG